MRELLIKPEICRYISFRAFSTDFDLKSSDVIFTEKFLYDTFIKKLDLPCGIIIRDSYGLGEPDDTMIDSILDDVNKLECSRIIAVGGGSVIDIGKIIALKAERPVAELFLKRKPIQKEKQLVIIPTTCGTGSEMTNISIALVSEIKTKLGIADDGIYADYAVLIPELVEGLPFDFFMYSAIDAMVHASEAFISPKATVFTETFSLQAFKVFLHGFARMVKEGIQIKKELAGEFLTASTMAGIAFGNAGVGAVHALAYPLGGNYHVAHGETNYQFFAEVFDFYSEKCASEKLNVLCGIIDGELHASGLKLDADSSFKKISRLLNELLPLKSLREYGMKAEEIPAFAKSVIQNQQRLLANTPIAFSEEDAVGIYKKRY